MAVHSFRGRYRFLSNFYPASVWYDGCQWPSAEHAYQAAKTNDDAQKNRIRHANTAGQAKRIGNTFELRPDWEDVKLDVMRSIVQSKFGQNPHLMELLKQIDGEIVEGNAWGDVYWGQCPLGTGENWLGRILMEIRDGSR